MAALRSAGPSVGQLGAHSVLSLSHLLGNSALGALAQGRTRDARGSPRFPETEPELPAWEADVENVSADAGGGALTALAPLDGGAPLIA